MSSLDEMIGKAGPQVGGTNDTKETAAPCRACCLPAVSLVAHTPQSNQPLSSQPLSCERHVRNIHVHGLSEDSSGNTHKAKAVS